MNPTRSVSTIAVLAVLTLGTAKAEFIGLDIGAQKPPPALSGSLIDDSAGFDLVDDLDVEDSVQNSMVLILEHPIPALPNIRYSGFELDSSGASTLDSNLQFGGTNFSSGDQVVSTFDLSQDDIVLYYQLAGSNVDLDLGVDLKRFDGEISMSGASSTRVDIDETIPLLYLSARFDWPNSGFYVGADINSNIIDLGLSNSRAEDSTIRLGYDSGTGLGVEGGFKYYSLELDDGNNLDTDLRYDGIFLNGYYNF